MTVTLLLVDNLQGGARGGGVASAVYCIVRAEKTGHVGGLPNALKK